MRTATRGVLMALACAVGCGSDESERAQQTAVPQGSERGACYPNGTCDDGLTCASDVCVVVADVSGTGGRSGDSKPALADCSACPADVRDTCTQAATECANAGGTVAECQDAMDLVCALTGGDGGLSLGGAGAAGSSGPGGSSQGGTTSGTGGVGGVCEGVGAAAVPVPVDMFVMFDKSTSMEELLGTDGRTKWDSSVAGFQAFVQDARAAGTGVGIQYFGQPDTCNPDVYAIPAVPIAPLPAAAAALITSTSNEVPSTLTPTAPALEGALRHMQTWAATSPDRASVVVLVTDGFPTQCGVQCAVPADCQSNTCVSGMCDPNSISEIEALAARYAAMDPPILTFVVGMGQGLANLNNIARGGGTGDAFLIDSGDVEGQFVDALLSISSTPLSCEFAIPGAPGDVVDPMLVQLVYTPAATGIPEEIPKLRHAGECALNYNEGWYYDFEGAPTKILVCPETCRSFAAGSVGIDLGCFPKIPILQ